jgi:hypothetical protein
MEEGQYKLINSYLSSDQVGVSGLSNGVDGDGVNKNSVGDLITDAAKGNGRRLTVLLLFYDQKREKQVDLSVPDRN